jgi:hypothetical protein
MNKSYSLNGGTMTLHGDNDSFRGLNRNSGGDQEEGKKKNPKNVDSKTSRKELVSSHNMEDGKLDDTQFKPFDQEPSEESSVVFDA